MKKIFVFETALWLISVAVILISFLAFGGNTLSLAASLIGATALIFVSKGNVIGQILTVVFSVFYGIISLSFGYYGEMITYLGMTTPIAVLAVISWLKNPYSGNRKQVKVNKLKAREFFFIFILGAIVTAVFYFILRALNNANLILSTLSVFTSFAASFLTMRRSEFYGLAYAANDIVLIALWVLASAESIEYLPMCICFGVFLVNDIYGFFNWLNMKKLQLKG